MSAVPMSVLRDRYARGVRRCTSCHRDLPTTAFPHDRRIADGCQARCRPCHNRATKESERHRRRLRMPVARLVRALQASSYFAEDAVRLGSSGAYRACICGRAAKDHPAPGCTGFFERGT